MKGTLVNAAAVAAGSLIGILAKRGVPERYQQTLMQGLGLSVGIIGLQMAVQTHNILIVIISTAIGSIIGEAIDIDKFLNRIGNWLTAKIGSQYGNVGQGFVTASLVYCVGAMAVVGAIQDGLTGNANTLYAKSLLDGISAIIFASTLGIGVILSSISILIYQGTITLLAVLFSSVMTETVISELTAVGGVLIIGISMLMLEIKTIKVANLLPAIPVAAVIAAFWTL